MKDYAHRIFIKESVFRVAIIITIVLFIFAYLFYVLYKVEIRNHDKYFEIRKNQNELMLSNSRRGTIYATRKDGDLVPLAIDEEAYKLIIQPKNIRKDFREQTYKSLNSVISLNKEDFMKKVEKVDDSYEEIAVVSEEESKKINDLYLDGVEIIKSYKRNYPFKEVGARVLGFVGGGDDGFSGRYGLEKEYESKLDVKMKTASSFFAKVLNDIEHGNVEDDSSAKTDLVTSLEPNVMVFLNNHLMEMKETWGADSVSGIIIKPKTGEIIAMDTVPSFDPNNYKDFPVEDFNNPNIQGVYELGSIMKPITMAGGIENKLVTPESVFHDYGFVKVDNYTIKNFDEKVRGDVTMQDVINQSLNTGAVYVQRLLGKEKFRNNFDKFGFETNTQVDFPGESFNLTDSLDTGSEVDYATAAFGQGVAVTPLSMIRGLSIIVNGGINIYPRFIKGFLKSDGNIEYNIIDQDSEQVISSSTAKTVENMMVTLIDEGLAHGRYKDSNYRVGAKTGTAQLPSPDHKYYKDKFIHSYYTFVGDGENRYAVLIFQVNPKKGMLASMTLAPAATKLKDFLITYYNIPPDR